MAGIIPAPIAGCGFPQQIGGMLASALAGQLLAKFIPMKMPCLFANEGAAPERGRTMRGFSQPCRLRIFI
jgi:hypothetical protein